MQNIALHCALGMESKVCLFSARPWDAANMLENLVRVHLLAKEKYQMVRIGAAEGPKIWCVGMYQSFIYHMRAIITRSYVVCVLINHYFILKVPAILKIIFVNNQSGNCKNIFRIPH